MPNNAEARAYKRGYNLINGAAFFYARPAADVIARYNAEAPKLREAFMRGVEAGERRREREIKSLWEDSRRYVWLLNQTERVTARCWAMNVALGWGGLWDATRDDGRGGQIAARTDELKAVVKRLVEGRLLKPEAAEEL